MFPSRDQQNRYLECFFSKPGFGPRYVKLDTFPYPSFQFREILISQKIEGLVSIYGLIFHDFVRAFYTNMIYKDDVITSTVKGKKIEFDCELLGIILAIPLEGLEFTTHKTLPILNYEKREFYFGIGRKFEHEIFQKCKKRTGGKLSDRIFLSAENLFMDDRFLY